MSAPRRRIEAPLLTREAFLPFGDVVVAERPDITPVMVNFGTAARRDHAATLDNRRPHSRPNLATFRCTPWSRFPVVAESMEKHPGSSQLFVPSTGTFCLSTDASIFALVVQW